MCMLHSLMSQSSVLLDPRANARSPWTCTAYVHQMAR